MEFGSIQTYSCYSAFYGTGVIKEYAKKAKALGHTALGICDRNTMAGLIQLEKYCREIGLKAVHGYDTYLYENLSKDDNNKCLGRVLLYAKNKKGFKNLIAINNFVNKQLDKGGGFYYRPRIDVDTLLNLSEGIILVIPTNGAAKLLEGLGSTRSKSSQIITQLASIFGDDFYIGTDLITEEIEKSRYKVVPTLNVACILSKHTKAANALRDQDDGHMKINIINDGPSTSLEDFNSEDLLSLGLDRFLSSIETNIVSIGTYHKIPLNHPNPSGYMLDKVREGWIRKVNPLDKDKTLDEILSSEYGPNQTSHFITKANHPKKDKYNLNDYRDRLKKELNVFTTFDKHEYFYPIKLACDAVDALGLFRGPGRGSGAGALYSYLVDLTRVDPMPDDLLFERFFSEARAKTDPPDYDADFSRQGRDVAYTTLKTQFGEDRVVKIGTYNRMKTKSAIKAVARSKAYGIVDNDGRTIQYEPFVLDRILDIHVTATSRGRDELEEMLLEEKFQDFYKKHSNWLEEYVLPLLESITNQSIHAAGAVITPGPFELELPLNFRNDEEGMTTQWEMGDLDTAGYLKYDLLVIDACDVVQDAINLIEQRHGIKVPSIEEICLSDKKTLAAFEKVLTRGIFQYNTFSQMRFLHRMKPKSFDDIVASVALIRPGPISAGAHDSYARRLNGEESVHYTFSVLEDILAPTYGLMIYQEQMMLIAQKLSSFTGVEAEALRKACGKKKIEEMKKWQEQFITRAVKNGHNEDLVKDLWEEVVGFAAYSFNKCLTGDVVVYRGGKNRFCDTIEIRIEDLYNESKANTSWGEKIRAGRQKIRMMSDDGRIRLGNIKSVVQNGVKPVFKVTLENGMSLKGTDNHRLLSTSGYKEISELVIGDELVVATEESQFRDQYKDRRVKTGYNKGKSWNFTETNSRTGPANVSYIDNRTALLNEAKQSVMDRFNGHCENCQKEKTEQDRFEMAHINSFEECGGDFSVFNNESNIKYLCNSCHKKLDYQKGERSAAWSVGKLTSSSKIISIEYHGEEMTYDIEMSNQEHNFVANGIVSHNSHSVSYSLISFYQMYIKVRFPTEYWCATLLRSKTQNKTGNSTYDLKAEAEKEGMEFIFPSATGFAEHFTVAGECQLYWPINVIKGVGPAAIEVLTDNGNRFSFQDMQHFVDVALSKNPRTGKQTVNAGTVKALVKAGFFNCWMEPWEAMREYNRLVALAKKKKEDEIDYEMAREDRIYWMNLRNEIFGCQVDPWKSERMGFSPEVKVYYPEDLPNVPDGSQILIGGQVTDILRKQDRNGNTWARIKIQDGAETFFVKAWTDWWGNQRMDRERTRPKVGDLIEILVNKTTFNDRPDLTIGRQGQYHRIVARP